MPVQLFAVICVLICIVALYIAWKVYKDTRNMKKKVKDDETRYKI